MNKYILIIAAILSSSLNVSAQQEAHYTQYIMNHYVLNPATGGVNNFWDIKAGYRGQWTGLEGAPTTFFVSGQGSIGYPNERVKNSHKKPHHGVGGYAYHDRTGPIRWSGVYGSYAYHIKLNKVTTLSMGAFVGMKQFQVDVNDLKFVEYSSDPLVSGGNISRLLPDASVGLWLYSKNYFAGISANQIVNNRLKLEERLINSNGRLNKHYFAVVGYRFSINPEYDFIPSVMIKYVDPAPVSFDINARVKYKDFIWGGVSYRNQDALALFAGVLINENFEFGYSYDITTSQLRKASHGSHEIIVGMRWPFRSSRIDCPNNFWD